ncbi:thioredoxin-like 1-1, chloroplastic isoform X2 [Eucalyptus grandis]|uniref:thioredoxin-like 1-1, chloroplastic isoform X2 n=1 Tax=Eucalyptus grandis TaxID=71139 RepID=UPI00192EFEA3|nr:thioredoxin-like 1-1, chloroplastic isoform X2 [Eucalyptus grandis]
MAVVTGRTSLLCSDRRARGGGDGAPGFCGSGEGQRFARFQVRPGPPSSRSTKHLVLGSPSISWSRSGLHGGRIAAGRIEAVPKRGAALGFRVNSQQGVLRIGKAHKWWEKGVQPNMKEVKGAQDLVESLLNAGDKLVVVDFFSPGCGGCKALHPKICQFAETNPDVQFLQVNYEEHKSMCYSLGVHVLPFFRFYRGAHGRLCSFSCTNATIKKFKDALAKHTPARCSLEPTKGLEEKELLALAANKELSFNYTPKPVQPVPLPAEEVTVEPTPSLPGFPLPLPLGAPKSAQDMDEKSLVTSGR